MKKPIRNFVYSVIDLITFRTGITRNINGFKIKFEPIWSRYYNKNYESDSFSFFKKTIKKGDTVFDIGAHIGLYSAPFGEMVGPTGKVYCFEPTPSTFDVLKKTIQLNPYKNVIPVQMAISDKNETVVFNLTSPDGAGSNANSIVRIERTSKSIEIEACSIDEFRRTNNLSVQILKIDVEGAELLALLGARDTFLNERPKGILALHPQNISDMGHNLEKIWNLLDDYRMNIFLKGRQITKSEFCAQTNLFDIEFIPRN